MMIFRAFVLCLSLVLSSGVLLAYDPGVHEQITIAALAQASLHVDFRARLGIDLDASFGSRTAREWAEFGARREDDIFVWPLPAFRSLNHFLDPVHGAPLTVGVWPACTTNVGLLFGVTGQGRTIPADAWALEPQFTNSWGLPKARDYQVQAMLGPNPGVRDQNVGFLFRSLGQIVHLVQDMAQPEHTRNDQHLVPFGVAPDLYELWGKANLVATQIPNQAALFTGYPTVVLPRFRDYFRAADGRGMANYSNRNFVTQDTNYHDQTLTKCFKYDFPSIQDASSSVMTLAERPLDDNGVAYTQVVVETVYRSAPVDLYLQVAESDEFHTLRSAFDAETKKYDPASEVYSLNDTAYLTRTAMLLPRAVGYSAGIVNHFFAGKIDATWKRLPAGPYAYDLTVTNRSSVAIGADARFSAIYKASPDYFNRTTSDDTAVMFMNEPLQSLVPGFDGLAPGEAMTIHVLPVFGLKAGDLVTEFERRIVIQGTLGDEESSVIGLVQGPIESSGLVATAKWDGTTFLSLAMDEYFDPGATALFNRTQACHHPVNGACRVCCRFNPNVTLLAEEAGLLSMRIVPDASHTYLFYLNSSSRNPTSVDLSFKRDGDVLVEETVVVPGCVTAPPACSAQLIVFRYEPPN